MVKKNDVFSQFDESDHFRPEIAEADFFRLKGFDLIRAIVMPLQNLAGISIQPEITFRRFSPNQKALYLWWMMDDAMNKGGFANYFTSNQSEYYPFLKKGMQHTGDEELEELLTKAYKISKKVINKKSKEDDPLGLSVFTAAKAFTEVDSLYAITAAATRLNFEKIIKSYPSDFCTAKNGDEIDPLYTGILETHFESGQLKEQIPLDKGQINGIVKTWFDDGTPCTEQTWMEGKQQGNQKTWYPNGQLRLSETFSDEGVLVEYWFEIGKKDREERYNALNQKHGVQKTWYENGTLAEEISYVNGNPNGPFLQFYPDKKKKLEAEFIDDVQVYRNYWTEKGRQLLKDGTGIYIFQPETVMSVLRREVPFVNYKRQGIIKEYMDDTLISTTAYNQDKKQGEETFFYDDGSVRQISVYQKGELVSTEEFEPGQKIK